VTSGVVSSGVPLHFYFWYVALLIFLFFSFFHMHLEPHLQINFFLVTPSLPLTVMPAGHSRLHTLNPS